MTARAICILLHVIAVTVALTPPATAQTPYIRVYSDPAFSEEYVQCGPGNAPSDLYVVLHNANMVVSAVDFTIEYPGTMLWIYDKLPYDWMVNNEVVTIGNSLVGIAIAWGVPWMQDGMQGPILVLRPVVLFQFCSCNSFNNGAVRVSGYAPLGKTQPSVIRYPDFTEFSAVGGTSILCFPPVATEQTTWGRVKALYRN